MHDFCSKLRLRVQGFLARFFQPSPGKSHPVLRCKKIKPGADFLLVTLRSEIPDLTFERIKHLDFRTEDLLVPTYLTAATLSQLWISRLSSRNFSLQSVRANVEQNILTLRKTRFAVAASKLHSMWNANVLVHDIVEN